MPQLRDRAWLVEPTDRNVVRLGPDLSVTGLPGNPAKIQLILDLATRAAVAPDRLRVLDIGIGGKYSPFSLWEPLAPLADRLDLYGIDVAHLAKTQARAAELGFPVQLLERSADRVVETFGPESFDAVVSTQVLEHLPKWPQALGQMASVLRPGGTLYVTCDSGDRSVSTSTHLRLLAKRWYARAVATEPRLRRLGGSRFSGDWEKAPRLDEVRDVVMSHGLTIETLRHFGLRDIKSLQDHLDPAARACWLDLELQIQSGDQSAFLLLYLRATKTSPSEDPNRDRLEVLEQS